MDWARLFTSPGRRGRTNTYPAAPVNAPRSDPRPRSGDHLRIQAAIDAQIDALETVALVTGPGCRDRSTTAVEQLLTSLRADRTLLREHWAGGSSTISAGTSDPAPSQGCGQPQPCPDTLALARKYHVRLG